MASAISNVVVLRQLPMPIAATNSQKRLNFQRCMQFGNYLMGISLAGFISAILIGYQFNYLVSMPVEIAAHIASMLLPGLFKIGYVLRCIGRKHLGQIV